MPKFSKNPALVGHLSRLQQMKVCERVAYIQSISESDELLALQVSLGLLLGEDAVDGDSANVEAESSEICYVGEPKTGGMGEVREAIWRGKRVAVKRLAPAFRGVRGSVRRFQRECALLKQLYHKSIVRFEEVLEDGSALVMAYVEGPDLQSWREQHSCTAEQAARIVSQISDAVAYAHQHGVVHRDIKPTNVMLASDFQQGSMRPMLVDFGIASSREFDTRLTIGPLGTFSYMAPEQFDGATTRAAEPAVDIYALGGLLYFLLSGKSPYQDVAPSDDLGRMRDVVCDPIVLPPSFRSRGIHCPPELETICFKCLQRQPEDRYQSAEELEEDLTRWLRGDTINAAPENWRKRTRRVLRRHRFPLMVSACLLAIGVTIGSLWIQATKSKRYFQASSVGLVGVLDSLANAVKDDKLLQSPSLAEFRRLLLTAYRDHNHLAVLGSNDQRRLRTHIDESLSVADIAFQTGELELAWELVGGAEELVGSQLRYSQEHCSVLVSKVRILTAQEEYEAAFDLGAETARYVELLKEPEERKKIEADLAEALYSAYYLAQQYPQALEHALRLRELAEFDFEANATMEAAVRYATAINAVVASGRKGGWLHKEVQDYTPMSLAEDVKRGLEVLDSVPGESPLVLEARARLNNSLALQSNALASQGGTLSDCNPIDLNRENIEIYKSLTEAWPTFVEYRLGLARSYGNLADAYYVAGESMAELEARKRCLRIYHGLRHDVGSQRDVDPDIVVHELRVFASEAEQDIIAALERARRIVPSCRAFRQSLTPGDKLRYYALVMLLAGETAEDGPLKLEAGQLMPEVEKIRKQYPDSSLRILSAFSWLEHGRLAKDD